MCTRASPCARPVRAHHPLSGSTRKARDPLTHRAQTRGVEHPRTIRNARISLAPFPSLLSPHFLPACSRVSWEASLPSHCLRSRRPPRPSLLPASSRGHEQGENKRASGGRRRDPREFLSRHRRESARGSAATAVRYAGAGTPGTCKHAGGHDR